MIFSLNRLFWSMEGTCSKRKREAASLLLLALSYPPASVETQRFGRSYKNRPVTHLQVTNSEERCHQRPSAGTAREAAVPQHSCSLKAAEISVSDRVGESHSMTSLSLSSRCLSKGGGAEKCRHYRLQRVRWSREG